MKDEIDLHGLTKIEAIEALIKFYNSRVKKGNLTPFEVIHGYGSSRVGGVLLTRIRGFLSNFSEELEFDYGKNPLFCNPGSTRVFPKKPLPETIDMLGEEILDFCEAPKTLSKIIGKFLLPIHLYTITFYYVFSFFKEQVGVRNFKAMCS